MSSPEFPRTLADVGAGDALTIDLVLGEEAFRRRLYRLGFLPGATVRVVRRMPAGGPLEVEVRGAHMGLRVRDAEALAGRTSTG